MEVSPDTPGGLCHCIYTVFSKIKSFDFEILVQTSSILVQILVFFEILVQTVLEKRLWMYNFYSVKIFSFFENEIAKTDNQQGPTV